ncbi:MAG: hypothetical protein BWY31_01802 [Lentisphaerae bacterium ADurb.Bin242]|nr:MAG: hypothetical protein BWY31_01802 [Lentisphaerae bacterium ADurb.Bin242]
MTVYENVTSSKNRTLFAAEPSVFLGRLSGGMAKFMLFLLATGVSAALHAGPVPVLAPSKPEDFTDLRSKAPLPYPEQNALLLNEKRAFYTKLVPVDTGKRYRLSGEFRLAPDSDELSIVFAVLPHTADGVRIYGPNICFVPGSESVLVSDAPKGGTVFKVKEVAKWDRATAASIGRVAFDTDPSGKQGDLPNFNLSPFLSSVADDGTVTLKKPLEKSYPAGTPVRLHLDRKFFGIFTGFEKLGDRWKTLSVTVSPGTRLRPLNAPALYDWWPGTAKAAILLYPFVPGEMPKGSGILFRNIKLEECD